MAQTPIVNNELNRLNMDKLNAMLEELYQAGPGGYSAAQIKALYEANPDTNALTNALLQKLQDLESSRFLGTFVDLGALQTAHPAPAEGSYAHVDTGIGGTIATYIWDASDTSYQEQLSGGGSETAGSIKTKYESNADTNAFTNAEKDAVAAIVAITVADTATIDLTLTAGQISGTIPDNAVTNTKLSAPVQASLTAADTASQPGHTHPSAEVIGLTTALADVAASKAITDLIDVTAPADLDAMQSAIAAGLSGAMKYKGNWDASTNTFPGGGR